MLGKTDKILERIDTLERNIDIRINNAIVNSLQRNLVTFREMMDDENQILKETKNQILSNLKLAPEKFQELLEKLEHYDEYEKLLINYSKQLFDAEKELGIKNSLLQKKTKQIKRLEFEIKVLKVSK